MRLERKKYHIAGMDLIRFEIRCVSHDRRRDVLTATQIK